MGIIKGCQAKGDIKGEGQEQGEVKDEGDGEVKI